MSYKKFSKGIVVLASLFHYQDLLKENLEVAIKYGDEERVKEIQENLKWCEGELNYFASRLETTTFDTII